VLSAFALLLVSNRELSLLDNAMVVYMMAGVVTTAGALIAVILGSDAFAGERERHTLVPLLTAPITSGQILNGKAIGLFAAWVVMYILAMPYVWAVGSDARNLVASVLCLTVLGTPVVIGFGFLAMALSARTGSVMVSLMTSLIVLLFAALPLVLDPSLRDSVIGRVLDMVNPFAGALNTYDATIVDREGVFRQIGRLALVWSWLVLAFWAARHAVRKPRFR